MQTKLSMLACVVVGVLATTGPARAADAKKPAAAGATAGASGAAAAKKGTPAEAAFRAGKKLFEAGNYHDAADKLEESYRLEPKTAKLLLLATAHDKDGRAATAWDEYKRVLDEATKAGKKKVADAARKAIADVYKKISYIKLDSISPNVATIEIDGKLIDKSGWATVQPFDPGTHEVKIATAGGRSKSVSMTLQPGPVTQPLTLPALDADPATPVAATTGTPDATATANASSTGSSDAPQSTDTHAPKKSGGHTVAYVVGGLGLVGVGVGSVFGVIALGDKSTVSKHCGAAAASSTQLTNTAVPCDAQGAKAESDGRTAGNISTIAMSVGGAALVTGVVLFFVLKGGDKAEKTGFRVTPTIPVSGSGAYGIQVGGAF